MPPALPGFYYDAEKTKYFKIQPNHVAAHGSARKYSKAAVKKDAEERREQKRRKLFEQRERKMRIQRSKVLESPLSGGWGVTREVGATRLECDTLVRAWAQGLQRKDVLNYRRPDDASGAFVFDTATGVLTYAETLGGNGFDARFFTFVVCPFCGMLGRGADGGSLRSLVVPPACDLEMVGWRELGAMSGGHVFGSQVSC